MKLNERHWKKFRVSDIFDVVYGVNLELNACQETTKDDHEAVNFVSRARDNNGVTAYIKPINGQPPQSEGIITVAGGGSSVLSTFVQIEPFYSGRDLYLLIPKDCYKNISLLVKLFLCKIIDCNKYKYSYGRQANRTLGKIVIEIPVNISEEPDWQFMEDYIKSLHSKPITTKNDFSQKRNLARDRFAEFVFGDLIDDIYKGKAINKGELTKADGNDVGIRYITRTAEDNGCELFAKLDEIPTAFIEKGNAISVGDTTATCFYQDEPFIVGDHMVVIRAKWLNKYSGLYITTLLNREQYKYSYGRAFVMDKIKNTVLYLPSTSEGEPDWQYMEDYIKSLPYGDRI